MDIFLVFQRPLYWLITTLTNVTLNYGIAIILFTLIIRGALAPLYVVQIKSSKKMMALSPRIKELQKKHGKDREALTRETMALYREHNHNPAMGCLLPLIQLPILWSLFLVLRNLSNNKLQGIAPHAANYLQHASIYKANFLWLYHGLGEPDPTHILPIVAGITQWIQQRMMLNATNDPQQRQMNQIMQFLPIMIVVFAWNYPSGLAVYWVTSNIMMMVLQYFIGGWGSLWSHPMSIPYADPKAAAQAARTSAPEGGLIARAFAAREASVAPSTANGRPKPSTSRANPESDAIETGQGSGGKMERYAQRHGRAGSRGRPSAKGAKK